MWKQDGNHPWKWNSKSYFTAFVSRQSPWDYLLHVNKECTSWQTTLKRQTMAGFPFFLPLFLSQWSVCLSDVVSLNNHRPIRGQCWPMRGGWWRVWWVALTGGSCLRVTGSGGAGSGSEYYGGVWEWGVSGDRLSVLLCHSRTTLSLTVQPEDDEEMTSDLGNIESAPDQWCWAYKVYNSGIKMSCVCKKDFCEQWLDVKVCKYFNILRFFVINFSKVQYRDS